MKSVMFAAMLCAVPAVGVVDAMAAAPGVKDGSVKVAVVLSEHATMIDFAGPWEVFQDAMLDDGHGNMIMPFDLYTVAPTRAPLHTSGNGHKGMTVTPDYSFADAPPPDIVVIGAQSGGKGLSEWLRKIHGEHKLIMSVCTGAFKLAKAGLLDGKQATTHHWYLGNLERDYPDIEVVKQVRYVQADPLTFTAGGLTSGVDLALHVVAERFGAQVAQNTADYMEYQGTGWKANTVASAFPTPVTHQEWSGKIGAETDLLLHVEIDGASPVLTTDIPAQNVRGAPTTLKSEHGVVDIAFDIAGHRATFDGKASDDRTITGTFSQDGRQQALTLRRQ